MFQRARALTMLVTVAALVAACGGSSAPDVTGGAASDSATLYKAANLQKVLTQAQSQLGGTPVTLLKIEPRDVKIIGQDKSVTVDNTGKSFVIATPSIPGQGSFALATVSPATVQSVVSAVESKANLKQSGIAYVTVTVDPINNKPYYGVYPVSGTGHYQADINGANLKSYGGSGGAAGGAAATSSGGSTSSGAASSGGGAQAIATCVQKAGTDPSAIAKCTSGGG